LYITCANGKRGEIFNKKQKWKKERKKKNKEIKKGRRKEGKETSAAYSASMMCCFHFISKSLVFTANMQTLARPASCPLCRSLSINVFYNVTKFTENSNRWIK